MAALRALYAWMEEGLRIIAKKTEHAGAKHGSGAYWGPKKDAKKESNTIRRRDEKQELHEQLAEGARRRAERDRLLAEEAIEEGLVDLKAGCVSFQG